MTIPFQSHRLWLAVCVAVLLVLVAQYHVFTSRQSPGQRSKIAQRTFTPSEVQEAVRAVLERLVRNQVIDGAVVTPIVHEIERQTRMIWPIINSSVPLPDLMITAATGLNSTLNTTSCPTTKSCVWPALRQEKALCVLPTIYVITPTYRRPEQMAHLTRLGQMFRMVPKVHWLVVEDSRKLSADVSALLNRVGVPHTHFNVYSRMAHIKERGATGVLQRNRALRWIRANAKNGTIYFADDDNTYDTDVFQEMRWTKRVSMWPVGLVTDFGVSSPVVTRNGTFNGFYDGWVMERKFPVDTAGFAVSVSFLLERPKAKWLLKAGYEEDGFLRSLAPFEPNEIELKADNCTKILVWHTQTRKKARSLPMSGEFRDTNVAILKKMIL